jgi:hypothetical protein
MEPKLVRLKVIPHAILDGMEGVIESDLSFSTYLANNPPDGSADE